MCPDVESDELSAGDLLEKALLGKNGSYYDDYGNQVLYVKRMIGDDGEPIVIWTLATDENYLETEED